MTKGSKKCTSCGEVKLLECFHKNNKTKDGLKYGCKVCSNTRFKEFYQDNRAAQIKRVKKYQRENAEAVAARNKIGKKKYYQKNKSFLIECSKKYQRENKEAIAERKKNYYQENKGAANARGKKWRQNNPEVVAAAQKKYSQKNKEFIAKSKSKHLQENPELYTARAAKRRAAKLNATPPWLTNRHYKDIRNIYAKAIRKSKRDGVKYHVDHVVPLRGKDVSGLHVPWNLQILTAEENLSKSNKYSDWD